jgi:hypothetical protein
VLLEKIVSEMKTLKTQGLEVITPRGQIKIYAFLAQFTGDNLGMNKKF